MTGQEERDVLFARLFGLTSVIQSGLLLRDTTLPSSSTVASDLASFKEVLAQLLVLGEKKSWLRESAWWSICLAVDALAASEVSWKNDAIDATIAAVYSEAKTWTPEKLALTLKLQSYYPSRDWKRLLSPTFKSPDLLSTGNLSTIARILKVRLSSVLFEYRRIAAYRRTKPCSCNRNQTRTRTRSQICRNLDRGSRRSISSGTCS